VRDDHQTRRASPRPVARGWNRTLRSWWLRTGAEPVQHVIVRDSVTFVLLLSAEALISIAFEKLRGPSGTWAWTEHGADWLLSATALLCVLGICVVVALRACATVIHASAPVLHALQKVRIERINDARSVKLAQIKLERASSFIVARHPGSSASARLPPLVGRHRRRTSGR
jgi:hypothetical protein